MSPSPKCLSENESGNDAGAVVLSMAQYGVVFSNCSFIGNRANSGNGKAALIDMSNGVGVLASGNEISFSDCWFANNEAKTVPPFISTKTILQLFSTPNFQIMWRTPVV